MENNKGLKIILIILIILTITVFVAITILYLMDKKEEAAPNTSYSAKASAVIQKYNLTNTINNKEYSQTLETILEANLFDPQYLDAYYEINYQEDQNFPYTISKLLTKNYNSTEINYIYDNYSNCLNILLDMNYINITNLNKLSNFDPSKLERYLQYHKTNNQYDIATVVTYVNIGLDLEGYSNYVSYTTEDTSSYKILVNKYHKLPNDYEPSDLVPLSYNSNLLLREVAAEAFEQLTSAATLDQVYFYPFSAYRSYTTQSVLYTRYKERDGETKADTYSARPGFSEHQLGLAVDVRSPNLADNITPETYEWLLNNSYKYGFIVRYPKGKQYITQYMEEPWHIRYLGIDLATKVHASNLTYDEYYDLYLETR